MPLWSKEHFKLIEASLRQLARIGNDWWHVPVIMNTEFGNKGSLSNYDPVKWRIVVWTCYTREVGMLFWSMSGVKTVPNPKPRGNANMYLGPESRKSFRVLMDLVRDLPVDMKPILTGFHNHDLNSPHRELL